MFVWRLNQPAKHHNDHISCGVGGTLRTAEHAADCGLLYGKKNSGERRKYSKQPWRRWRIKWDGCQKWRTITTLAFEFWDSRLIFSEQNLLACAVLVISLHTTPITRYTWLVQKIKKDLHFWTYKCRKYFTFWKANCTAADQLTSGTRWTHCLCKPCGSTFHWTALQPQTCTRL